MAPSVDANALHGRPGAPLPHQYSPAYCIRITVAAVLAITGVYVSCGVLTERLDNDQPHRQSHHRSIAAVVVWLTQEYPKRFMSFYTPKVRAARDLAWQALDLLWASEDVRGALDFTAALVVVASLFHLLDTWRVVAVRKLRTPTREDASASESSSATLECER